MALSSVNYVSKKIETLNNRTLNTLLREAKRAEFTQTYNVTPEVAKVILEKFNPNNRHINEIAVDSLARDMTNDRWLGHVGDEVTFDNEGNLNNGQHRLSAIIKSGTTQQMGFRFGISPDSRLVEGRGRVKQFADFIAMTKGKDSLYRNNRAAAVRLLFGFVHDQSRPQVYCGNAKPTNGELNEIEAEFGDAIYESLKFVMEAKVRNVTIETNAALLHFLFKRSKHGKRADEFFEGLASGANLNSDDPRFVVRNRLLADAMSKQVFRAQKNKDATMGLIVKAWNAWNAGKTWSSKERTPEQMPQIEGLVKVGSYKLYAATAD